LLLLCPTHHAKIDAEGAEKRYTIGWLQRIKSDHEKRCGKTPVQEEFANPSQDVIARALLESLKVAILPCSSIHAQTVNVITNIRVDKRPRRVLDLGEMKRRRNHSKGRSFGPSPKVSLGVPAHTERPNLKFLSIQDLINEERPELVDRVWVFSARPLETGPGSAHLELNQQVFKNLLAGVKYTYFVKLNKEVTRIMQLLRQMASMYARGNEAVLGKLKKQVTVVVIPEQIPFLTHYCIHHRKDGSRNVYQDILEDNENDKLTKLPKVHANDVFWEIEQLTGNTVSRVEDGVEVRRPHP
jgi:hypothetical protein